MNQAVYAGRGFLKYGSLSNIVAMIFEKWQMRWRMISINSDDRIAGFDKTAGDRATNKASHSRDCYDLLAGPFCKLTVFRLVGFWRDITFWHNCSSKD